LPFCPNCGAAVQPNSNFCPSCGQRLTPVQQPAQASPQQAPPPQQVYQQPAPTYQQPGPTYQQPPPQAYPPPQPVYQQPPPAPPTVVYVQVPPAQPRERVIAVVPNMKKMKFMGSFDLYTMVVTEQRAIFAHITKDMADRALKEAQAKAKSEGKGFFDQWGAMLNTSFHYSEKYEAMEPEAVLREQHDNFDIEHNGITRIKCWKNRPPARQKSNFELLNKYTYDIELETRQGKMKYTVDDHDPSSELSKGFGSKYH